jgi:hypothetical protein
MNIFEKMSAVTNEITAVAKNLNVGYGRSSYKATGEADVLAAVKPAEAKNRIYSYPVEREIVESGVLTSVKSDGSELKQNFLRVRVVYRFVDMDDPATYIDIVTYGDGIDPGDKAPGKAMTYADKYALLKAYKIITGDDPDQYASEPLKSKETPARAYPSRREMEAACEVYYKGENLKRLLEYYKVDTIKDLNDGQLVVAYTQSVKGRQKV